MNSSAHGRRRYDASGRQAQALATRDAIVDAAMARLRRVRPEELAYADLADDAGIALRTVYRHFPTLHDLLAAALQRFLGEIVGSSTLQGKSAAELSDLLGRLHARLSAEPGLYRLFFVLPARSQLGMATSIKELCRDALAKLPAAHHDAVCAAVELMLGPYAWETFHSHWGVSPDRMTRTVLASVQVLLDHFAAHPELLDDDAERPPMFREAPRPRSKSSASRRTPGSGRSSQAPHKRAR